MTVISGTERGGGSEGERDLETNTQTEIQRERQRETEGGMDGRQISIADS